MSAKILHSLTDESPDFHKQIGCMSGIFQLFDRHHFPAGRRINGNSHKRLPPGENGNHAVESKNTLQKATVVKEKHRNSTESSRTTVSSSSCSSSFSSLEFKKAAEQEPSLSSQTISNEEHTRDLSMNQPNASMHLRRQSFDMQDLVKDSTYREARGISVKPAGKDGVDQTLLQIFKSNQRKQARSFVWGIPWENTERLHLPKRRSTDSVMKPASNSKFPIETAPWRQPHGSKGSQRSASKYQEEPIKTPKSASSVYGEMEKKASKS
ncbi:hypothetical protein GBA52_028828 [Prunus armeniaca]|nr:hypothetical protein GBA52_028828 [Prunus armeniaca]